MGCIDRGWREDRRTLPRQGRSPLMTKMQVKPSTLVSTRLPARDLQEGEEGEESEETRPSIEGMSSKSKR